MQPTDAARRHRSGFAGLAAGLAAITMFFAALASAWVVRRGIAADWRSITLPYTVYLSVVPIMLAAGSLALAARRVNRVYIICAVLFGTVFAVEQISAWPQLRSIHSPAADFFLIMSGAIVCCVLGGLAALCSPLGQARKPVEAQSYYWIYVNVLWLALLLFVRVWN